MTAHMIELERTLARNQDRLKTAMQLQSRIGRIAASKARIEVVSEFLHTLNSPLGFSRAVYFDVENCCYIGRTVFDNGQVAELDSPLALLSGTALRDIVTGAEIFVGKAGELGTPMIDVRDWFILTALRHGSQLLGVAYADGHESHAPLDETAALLRTTTSIAAVALANVMLYEQTRQLAMCDPLTGLLNRRAFSERLEQEIERCDRQNVTITCVMLDIDDFKTVNDRHGHAHGDHVLQRVAATLRSVSRAQDVLCRYAGDEFVVIFVDSAAASSAALVGRLSAELRTAGLRCSLGAARYPQDASDAAALLAVSDRALYRAKASGKDRFAFA